MEIVMKTKTFFSLLVLILTSCNNIVDFGDMDYVSPENKPNEGAPEIYGIYEVRDIIYDNALTAVNPGQRIRIHGKNLNFVQQLSFNGFEVPSDQIASGGDYCVVKVPEEFDIVQKEGMKYTTDMGTTSVNITVTPLPLVMKGLINTFIAAGSTAAVGGKYFNSYHFGQDELTSVILNGTTALKMTDVTSTGMNIEIPAGTPDNSTITFNWMDGDGNKKSFSNHYRPSSDRCFETLNLSLGDSFNDQEGYNLNAYIEEDGTDGIPSLGSPILRFTGRAKQWGWYSANIDSELKTQYDIAGQNEYDPSLTKGYRFEFEAMTLSPIPSSADGSNNGIMFSIEWGDSYEWSPTNNSEPFDTKGQWVTVSLPLNKVATKGMRPVNWGGTTHLGIILSPIVDNAEYELRLSNFRIVKDLNPEEEEEPAPEPAPEPTPEPTPEPNANYGIIFNTETVMGGWTTIDENTLSASLFTGIKAGDKIIVNASASDGGQVWIKRLTGSSWSETSLLDGVSISTSVSYTFTEDDINEVTGRGIRLNGKNFTLTSIELEEGSK